MSPTGSMVSAMPASHFSEIDTHLIRPDFICSTPSPHARNVDNQIWSHSTVTHIFRIGNRSNHIQEFYAYAHQLYHMRARYVFGILLICALLQGSVAGVVAFFDDNAIARILSFATGLTLAVASCFARWLNYHDMSTACNATAHMSRLISEKVSRELVLDAPNRIAFGTFSENVYHTWDAMCKNAPIVSISIERHMKITRHELLSLSMNPLAGDV